MLNEMRFGKLRKSSIDKFYALKRELKYSEIEPTELFPMRHDVDRANTNRLRSLAGESRLFRAEDSEPDPSKQGQWFKNIMAPDVLELKIGAQVMLIKNLDQNLVNGTVGHVVGFGVPELADEEEEEEGGREGWTLNSRDEPVRVKGEMSVTEARKRQKIAEGVASGRIEQGPVVAWQTPNGIEKKVMVREEFKHEDNNGQKLSWRKQYPIILAWAMRCASASPPRTSSTADVCPRTASTSHKARRSSASKSTSAKSSRRASRTSPSLARRRSRDCRSSASIRRRCSRTRRSSSGAPQLDSPSMHRFASPSLPRIASSFVFRLSPVPTRFLPSPSRLACHPSSLASLCNVTFAVSTAL
ncbi:hypothetical protein AAT19DRAFT_8840 [Rhodotorula toruloides]|uniref:DNA helicase Pif1-like 2B domain-containing protein n=1 Tax=Rhodotorula toruloides TaxID=5286 RepID=A0A2T0AIF4_RHOTO|nr:hypothetical protein AAT19DRAFT_8840 [Rhodotorula toruloides]